MAQILVIARLIYVHPRWPKENGARIHLVICSIWKRENYPHQIPVIIFCVTAAAVLQLY